MRFSTGDGHTPWTLTNSRGTRDLPPEPAASSCRQAPEDRVAVETTDKLRTRHQLRPLVATPQRWEPLHTQEFRWSGWPDLNRRPLDPQSSALTKLRHSPYGRSVTVLPGAPGLLVRDSREPVEEANSELNEPDDQVKRGQSDEGEKPDRPTRILILAPLDAGRVQLIAFAHGVQRYRSGSVCQRRKPPIG